MSNPKVLIIAPRLASLSETFIYDQIEGINNFTAVPVCHERVNPEIYKFTVEPIVLGTQPIDLYDRIISKIKRIINGEYQYSIFFSAQNKIKEIIVNKDIKLIHCHYGPTAISLLPLIRKYKIPLLVTFHGYDASMLLKDRKYINKLKQLFSHNVYSITQSHDMELRLSKYGLHSNRNRIIPCGIDTNYFKKSVDKTISNPLVLLHSGRVTPKKGVLDLVKIFAEIHEGNNILLWIVGDGLGQDEDEYEMLKSYVSQNQLSNKVILWGRQPREKVKELMQMADIFILNSRTSKSGDMEGLPVSILEAMASGLPVISTFHSGIPDIIQDGENGLLVNEFNNEELKNAIIRLIKNPSLMRELSENAYSSIRKRFTKDITITKIETFYSNIINRVGDT